MPSTLTSNLTVLQGRKITTYLTYVCGILGHPGSLGYKIYVHKMHNYIVHVFCFSLNKKGRKVGKKRDDGKREKRKGKERERENHNCNLSIRG